MKGHSRTCKEYEKTYSIFTKEFLLDLYITKGLSVLDIVERFNLPTPTRINRLLIKYDIPRRTKPNSRTREKYKSTMIERTGFSHNLYKGAPSRIQMEEKLMREEGITNVFQRKEVKEKILDTMIEKYGVETPSQITMSRGKNSYSSVHKLVVEKLLELGIELQIELKLKKEVRYYSYDILCSGKIIEINGDYWHGNPKMYKPDDLIMKGSSAEIKVKDKWEYDKIKIQHAIDRGYEVLVIWESEIIENLDLVIEKILRFVGKEYITNN